MYTKGNLEKKFKNFENFRKKMKFQAKNPIRYGNYLVPDSDQ